MVKNVCTNILKKYDNVENMFCCISTFIDTTELSNQDVSKVIKYFTKNKHPIMHTCEDDTCVILSKLLEKYTLSKDDVSTIISCMLLYASRADDKDIPQSYSKIIEYMIKLKYAFDQKHICDMIKHKTVCVYNSYIDKLTGTIDEIDAVYIYHKRPRDAHLRNVKDCINAAKIFYDIVTNMFMKNNTKITEEVMLRIMMHNIHVIGHCENNNDHYIYSTYNAITTDLYMKFKEDYHEMNNKNYTLSHKMLLYILLSFDGEIELLESDILNYFNNIDQSADFFASTFYSSFLGESYDDTAIEFDIIETSRRIHIYDIENGTAKCYQLTNFIFKNIVYVAYLGILNKVKNYKMLFRIFFCENAVDDLYTENKYAYISNDAEHERYKDKYDCIDINNVYDKFKKMCSGGVIHTDINRIDMLKVRTYFMKIMYDMRDEIIFEDDDIEYACEMSDGVAMRIIMKRIMITDNSIVNLCQNCDKFPDVKLMLDNIFDNRAIPKLEHLRKTDNIDIINLFLEHGLDITEDLMKFCTFKGLFFEKFHDHIQGFSHISDELYMMHYKSNISTSVKNGVNKYADGKLHKTIDEMSAKFDENVHNIVDYLNNFYAIRNEFVKYFLYNNMKVSKSLYATFVNMDVHSIVNYCEKYYGYHPNMDTLMLLCDTIAIKYYTKRIIMENNRE